MYNYVGHWYSDSLFLTLCIMFSSESVSDNSSENPEEESHGYTEEGEEGN